MDGSKNSFESEYKEPTLIVASARDRQEFARSTSEEEASLTVWIYTDTSKQVR